MEVLKRAATALLLCAAPGCAFERPPTTIQAEEQVQLHSLLRAGSDTVAVLVERVGADQGALWVRPVSGARVRIGPPGAGTTLAEAPAGFRACLVSGGESGGGAAGAGCYAGVLPGGVRAGGEYTLSVTLPEGTTVAGRTTVPLPPDLIRPEEGVRVPVQRISDGSEGRGDLFPVRWRVLGSGGGAALTGRVGAVYRGGVEVNGAGCTLLLVTPDNVAQNGHLHAAGEDSLMLRPLVYCTEGTGPGSVRPFQPDSVDAVLSTTVYDSVYTRYTALVGDDRVGSGAASAGITGANGVFGSAATAGRRIRLVFPPR